ncbi:MAG: DUF1501 domain-containing protein [Hyphomicrobiaceae bacterium]
MSCTEHSILSRRQLLKGSTASLALWGFVPKAAIAGTRDPRLLTIVLRGGLDGLSMIAPVGDPDYQRIRLRLALSKEGPTPGLPLDDFFLLNAAMPYLHSLYQKREALGLHAVATPYRGRSHFDGQDMLESGLPGVTRTEDGWLNRALSGLSVAGKADPKGLAMGAVVPLVMRGAAPVMTWIPKAYGIQLRDSTIARLMDLYGQTDPKLAKAFAEGLEIDKVGMVPAKATAPTQPQPPRPFRDFIETAETAAKFLSAADGPRVGALSYNGWDTHANEGAVQGQLATRLAGLDAAIKAFAEGMGPAWKDTVVVIVTEFGRTAHTNGTEGTDHGTGMASLLVGGAVKGGRVLAKWPGLADKDLYEGRDLNPTMDLRAVFKGVLRDHLGIPAGALASKVFPDSRGVEPLNELLV